MESIIPVNKYQTPVTRELMDSLPEEIQEQLLDCVTNIDFIRNLISPDRPYAKDLERDEKGRIKVDLTNPHIIEDADYFRKPALHFMEHGCYTFLKPNSNPNSAYRKFWDEEIRRCLEGYVRESDGEWVTGTCYWFLNYNPMMVNKIKKGTKTAARIESFPFFFEGIYWRFHYLEQARKRGQHAIELAKRGCAKSYSLSSIMTHNLILGESADSRKRIITVLAAYQKEYLKDDKDGTLSKFRPAINFIFSNTPFPRLMLKNSPNEMSWQMGYKDEYGRDKGSLNTVLAVSIKDDKEKLRGKRGNFLFEEMGSMPGLISVYDVCRKSVEDGEYAFGQIFLVGTAAEKESDFESAKTLLYNPKGYNIYELLNVYDKKNQGKNVFGFFFPAYINRAGCYNEDGVSDVIKALIEILTFRYNIKYNSTDANSVLRAIAEDPITPAEAIIKVKDAFFPKQALTERLLQVDSNPHFYDDVYVGDLVQTGSTVEFKMTHDLPIRVYKVDNTERGAIEIFNMPEKDSNGSIPINRYIIGYDPVNADQAESSSLASIFVLDMWTDRIVAEYTGRQPFADDNSEIARKLCLFYNAKCLYESNIKGPYAYFKKMNCTHLLLDTPEYLRDKQIIKYSSFGSSSKGVNASAAVNNYANQLTRDWLLKPVIVQQETPEGENIEVTFTNIDYLRNRAFMEELISFNTEGNFDRIRSFGMLMLYREELMILYGGNPKSGQYTSNYKDNKAYDDFFSANYDSRFISINQNDIFM